MAAGLVPFAIGSETWGSILIPANNCGLAGLRPTYGRVSRYGAMALCWTLDKLGPLCLTADDCGIVLEAIAGPDPQDACTHPEPFTYDPNFNPGRRYRIGVPRGVLGEASDAVKENFEAAIEIIGDVAEVEEAVFPEFPCVEITSVILMVESASAFEDFMAEGGPLQLSGTGWHGRSPYARPAVLATDYIKALRLRGVMARQVDEIMAGYDAIAAPTAMNTATPIDQEFRSRSMTSAGAGDVMGFHRQRLRPALHFRAQRLRRRRPAHGHPVHGPRLRRERLPGHSPGIPGADGMAWAAPGGCITDEIGQAGLSVRIAVTTPPLTVGLCATV